MDDVIAVEVVLTSGESRYFLTWGRIYDAVDTSEVEAVVLRHCHGFALGGEPESAKVCRSLRDAAGEVYFYESFFEMAGQQPQVGQDYKKWREKMRKGMEAGHEIWYLGKPREPVRVPGVPRG